MFVGLCLPDAFTVEAGGGLVAQVFGNRRHCKGGGWRVAAIAVVVIGIAAGGIAFAMNDGGGVVVERSDESAAEGGAGAVPAAVTTASAAAVVHVDGAVNSPGVYEISADAPRVNDAVTAAGGLAENADTSSLNLAAVITDGSKVHVPSVDEASVASASSDSSAGDASGGDTAGSSGLVNINTATAEELDTLPGVGPSTAATIIEDREQNGPFSSIEDLMRVSGIGEKKYAKLQGSICV